jgi:hypothetical protein
MRKQETDIWGGGMLAVRNPALINAIDVIIILFYTRTRWGKFYEAGTESRTKQVNL